MRVLILGGDGMLGHQLFKQLRDHHEVRVTLHAELRAYDRFGLFSAGNAYAGVDVRERDRLMKLFSDFRPEAVVNAVGIVKQRAAAGDSIPSLEINALLPHRLAEMCRTTGSRLVHMSTDCVFSGNKGNYQETDVSDAADLYGRTKFLGEVHAAHCVTLRTSIIGPELSRKKSLLEWFLAQSGSVRGFTRAIFSGFTTLEMSRIIDDILVKQPGLSGLYHVSSDPISKFDLLNLIKQTMRLPIEIVPHDEFSCDRSLDSSRFREATGYTPPGWDVMIKEMVQAMNGTS